MMIIFVTFHSKKFLIKKPTLSASIALRLIVINNIEMYLTIVYDSNIRTKGLDIK